MCFHILNNNNNIYIDLCQLAPMLLHLSAHPSYIPAAPLLAVTTKPATKIPLSTGKVTSLGLPMATLYTGQNEPESSFWATVSL